MKRSELIAYLDGYLQIAAIKDYGPQGLQVEGREQVNKVVGMVDAQLPCLEAALAHGADMLLVHHGIFWGPPQRIAGSFGQLVRVDRLAQEVVGALGERVNKVAFVGFCREKQGVGEGSIRVFMELLADRNTVESGHDPVEYGNPWRVVGVQQQPSSIAVVGFDDFVAPSRDLVGEQGTRYSFVFGDESFQTALP